MERPVLFVSALALTLALAACSPQPPGPTGDPQSATAVDPAETALPPAAGAVDNALEPAAPGMDPCDAEAVQTRIGEQATDDLIEQARVDAGAEIVRTLRPDQAVTMDYRAGRLNIDVDDTGTITGLRCG